METIDNLKNIRDINRTCEFRHLRRVLLEHFKFCFKCNSMDNLEIDHIKSVRYYPTMAIYYKNLQVLCKKCNQKKGSKAQKDYRRKRKEFIESLLLENNAYQYHEKIMNMGHLFDKTPSYLKKR